MDFFVKVAKATGQELQALQLQVESARSRLKLAKNKDDKELQDATIAFLEADKALKDYYAEKDKERKEKLKKIAEDLAKKEEELQKWLSEMNQYYADKNLKRIAENEKSFIDSEKKKREAAMETNKILQEQADFIVKTNAENLQKLKDQLDYENGLKQEAYIDEQKAKQDKEEAIKETSIQIAQQTADAVFQIVNTQRNNDFNASISNLEKLRDRELSGKDLTEAQKARIEERYQRKIAEIKTKQAIADRNAALAQAIINGALAITKTIASLGFPAAIPAVIAVAAQTALQVAVIGAQKIPKFAKCTEYVNGGGTETSDSVPAMLSRGERVIDAKTNKLLKGIPNALIPDLLIPKATMIEKGMDYDRMAKAFSKELAANPKLMVNFNKSGFETFIISGNTTTNVKNNRNDF